jgi:predicted nuclease of predicted toxin-antitoxin system
VRFLIDENRSPRICTLLIAGGHHATHIRDHGMASASDPKVLAKAATEVLTPSACRGTQTTTGR